MSTAVLHGAVFGIDYGDGARGMKRAILEDQITLQISPWVRRLRGSNHVTIHPKVTTFDWADTAIGDSKLTLQLQLSCLQWPGADGHEDSP